MNIEHTELTGLAGQILEDFKKPAKGMSEAAAAKLRAIGEAERADQAAQKDFVERFERLPKDTWALAQVLSRCSTDQSNLERRANKLRLSLRLGLKASSVGDVFFLAELTREEAALSDEKFIRLIEVGWNTSPIVKPAAPPAPKLCALGSKCFRSYKRKAAEVTGSGLYCSAICKGSARARSKRLATS
jgi:hypothetical protein